jgi:bifunctional non-homologous end joining protein LigD
MGLEEYKRKRNKNKTPEPFTGKSTGKNPIFVVQEHHASHLHFDFRLEAFGVLKSWAVPKGPSMEVGAKRLAVEVEDHPIDYAKFEGKIPKGEYGGGTVEIWDNGFWRPPKNLRESLDNGHLEFELKGKKLKGKWLLQRTARKSGRKNQWLLIKRNDSKKTSSETNSASRKDDTVSDKLLHDQASSIPTPQLATLVQEIPNGPNWVYEAKLDGYRTLASVKDKQVNFFTRSGLDWTEKYRPLDIEILKLESGNAVFDGEIVALDKKGHSNFSELQNALKESRKQSLVYYVFDLLYHNGKDLRSRPLEERKLYLKQILKKNKSKQIQYSEHHRGNGEELYKKACKEGLEGIVCKNRLSPYEPGRGVNWQKVKCSLRQEFVVVGYTNPEGARKGFGALLMGSYENKKLRYVGRVGTGFDNKTIKSIMEKIEPLSQKESPLQLGSIPKNKDIHWVKPEVVAEIEFKTWTKDLILRQASFQGLREDKPATEVHAEIPVSPKKIKLPDVAPTSDFKITHPDRVLYPKQKITKLDVAKYYNTVSPWVLEHVSERPIALLRCHDEVGDSCFFQKHINVSHVPSLFETYIHHQKAIYLKTKQGLLNLVQMGVVEFHFWQCHMANKDSPDQIIFDLDPDSAIRWSTIKKSAFRLKELLEKLGLESFVKTTGGKGLHIHVPIAPKYSWESTLNFARGICQQLELQYPDLYITQSSKKKRTHKIFLDYLRNGFGATAVAPYSLRAKDEPWVATPITWKELEKSTKHIRFDMNSVQKRLSLQKETPWVKYKMLKQKIKILEVSTYSEKWQ